MRFSSLVPSSMLAVLYLASTILAGTVSPTHFVIDVPSKTSPWKLDSPNPLAWSNAQEGILQFDVELLRLSATGLLLVAKNVPVKDQKAVIDTEGIAPGDDYFVVFMDSYDGTVYSRSSRFSILANNTQSTTVDATLTMTITGAPNPTRAFETTLPALVTTTTSATNAGYYGAPASGGTSDATRTVKLAYGGGAISLALLAGGTMLMMA